MQQRPWPSFALLPLAAHICQTLTTWLHDPASYSKAPARPLAACPERVAVCVCFQLCLTASGGRVSEDVIRSLAISQQLLGTEEVAVIHHTGELAGHWMLVAKAALAPQLSNEHHPLLRHQIPEHPAHLRCPLDHPHCCSHQQSAQGTAADCGRPFVSSCIFCCSSCSSSPSTTSCCSSSRQLG